MGIIENAEYCDGQDFQVVFVTMFHRLWQCKRCAFEMKQPLNESEILPVFPVYHPKPIPLRFTTNDAQEER